MELEVRLFDKNTLKRKTFPMQAVSSVQWEMIEKGFYGTFSVQIQRDILQGYTSINDGDRVEVWVDGNRRFRGYVAVPSLGMTMQGSSEISGYGLAERLGTIIVRKRYVYSTETDISQFVTDLAADYLLPRLPGLETDIQATGYTTKMLALENSDARTVLSKLIELCANQAYWGIDVDPATGADRFFFRPKNLTTAKYKLAVGNKVQSYTYPPDYSGIVNCVRVVGGKADKPNLFVNPSFEQPAVADETNANQVKNPSFEQGDKDASDYWEQGDATRSSDYPHSGGYCLNMDRGGDSAAQKHINLVPGETYVFGGWVYSNSPAAWHLLIIPDVGETVRYPAAGSFELSGTAEHSEIPKCEFVAPAGSSECTIQLFADHRYSAYFNFDDLYFYRKDHVIQLGWAYGKDNQVQADIDWKYGGDASHGEYSVRSQVSDLPAGKYAWIYPSADCGIEIKGQQAYTLSFYMKDLSGASAPCKFVLWVNTSDGDSRWVEGPFFGIAKDVWDHKSWRWTSGDKDAKVWPGIKFIGISDYLVDAMMFKEFDSGDPTGTTFIPGDSYEWIFRVDDDSIKSRLPLTCQRSIEDHGLRDADESVDGLSDTATAQSWAVGYFGVHAQPEVCHAVEVFDCTETVSPDGMVGLIGIDIPDNADLLKPAWPSKARYSTDGDIIKLSLDLNSERPSFEKLLRDAIEEAKNDIKTSGASSSSASPSTPSANLSSNHSRFHLLDGPDHTNVAISDLHDGDVLRYSSADGLYHNSEAVDATAVHRTGDETIEGAKTFTSSPTVPEPTSGTDAANKAYVDSVAGGGSASIESAYLVEYAGDTYTTPSAFDAGASYQCGEITSKRGELRWGTSAGNATAMFSMMVHASQATNVSIPVLYADDWVALFIDGAQVLTHSSGGPFAADSVSLTAGDHLIQVMCHSDNGSFVATIGNWFNPYVAFLRAAKS